MSSQRIPKIDSIEELARFWDEHDITDFEEELEEVNEPVFGRRRGHLVTVRLDGLEAEALRRIASDRGIEEAALIQEWVREKLTRS